MAATAGIAAGSLAWSAGIAAGPADAATTYHVQGTTGSLAVQSQPAVDHVTGWLANGAAVQVVCQINNGGTDPYDGLTSRTWDELTSGNWVYDWYVSTPRQGSDGFSPGVPHCDAATGLNPYNYPWPYPQSATWVADGHGYWEGECTSFAAWAIRADGRPHRKSPDWLGDASMWTGSYSESTPHVGDIAQWDPWHNQAFGGGHVAYVAAVYPNGTIKVYEYNWGNFHQFNIRVISSGAPSRYLHF
ncbi:MAG: CHAP domain-containing protein [Streptosporangiaceae bacterium]|nr:CHAP domain-containing protein [Streptosporangiaceae bacterium]MBV9855130.1 CHAP domain-containing protein [Streptosporangiaceae bacterium]